MSPDPYAKIAPYYDLLHASLTEDIGLVLSLAAQTGDPVLELGCGTGRLLAPLARAGYRVTGVDRSEAMLARARQRLEELPLAQRQNVTMVAADMSEPSLQPKAYRLALIPYNTFMHLDPAAARQTCRALYHCLQPGGTLFIDLVNPLLVEQTTNDHMLTLERTLTDVEDDCLVLIFASNHLEEAVQTLTITWIYDVSPCEGGPVQRTVVEVAYHYYHAHQIELLLQECGFRLQGMYGDYRQQPFSESAERLLVLARRD